MVTYQLELLHVDLWKHTSFPRDLRPNWCHSHTSERNSLLPYYKPLQDKYITGWEGIQRSVSIIIRTQFQKSQYETALTLFCPCFTTQWHMLSFIASENILAVIQWGLKIFQWHNPYCMLDIIEVFHAYLGLAWAMLNVSQKHCYAEGNIIHIKTLLRDNPLKVARRCAESKNLCLALGAYHTNQQCRRNGTENFSHKDSKLIAKPGWEITSFKSWMSTLSKAWSFSCHVNWARKQNTNCNTNIKNISKISLLPAESQSHNLHAASVTVGPSDGNNLRSNSSGPSMNRIVEPAELSPLPLAGSLASDTRWERRETEGLLLLSFLQSYGMRKQKHFQWSKVVHLIESCDISFTFLFIRAAKCHKGKKTPTNEPILSIPLDTGNGETKANCLGNIRESWFPQQTSIKSASSLPKPQNLLERIKNI